MTISNIVIKNIKGNLSKYVMYYLSNVIVVAIFFIFANFIYNPGSSAEGMGNNMKAVLDNIMYLSLFVIVIFTFIFSAYSIGNFLKSREKEFGLLAMFGLTKSQIRRYVMIENIIISTASIITGLLFGLLFSKLFFMAVTAILDFNLEIKFMISGKAVFLTIISFFIVLNFISFAASFKIKNNNIAQLLKGSRVPKKTPKFSKVKSILSIVLIVSGYIWGVTSKGAIVLTMIPIFIMEVIGTRLLFTQFTIYFADKLHRNKNISYKGINIITISQIIYKLKDNAKVLFITSILSGVTLATAVSVYSLEKISMATVEDNCPNDIGIYEQSIDSCKVVTEEDIKKILNKHGFNIDYKNKIHLIKAENNEKDNTKHNGYNALSNKNDFYVMNQSSFNEYAKHNDRDTLNLKSGQSVIYSYDLTGNIFDMGIQLPFKGKKDINLNVDGSVTNLKIIDNVKGGILNKQIGVVNSIIVNDNDFKKIYDKAPDNSKLVYYGYNIKHNLKASDAVEEINKLVSEDNNGKFYTERVTSLASILQSLSVILFIGTFIAVIFFVATGSILYFKMFNEIQKDKQDFIGLKKIGVTHDEIKKTISIQSFIMFFVPLIVAVIHAAFAVKSVCIFYAKYFLVILAIYLVLQIIFYLFARWMYVKQIDSWKM